MRQSGRAQREARVLAAARDLFTTQGYDPLLAKMFGEDESIAFLGRIARIEACPPSDRDFAGEVHTMFDPWHESVRRQPTLVRTFLLDGLPPGTGRSEERRREDAAVVDAICMRLLTRHPSLDHHRARNLSYAAYSAHAVALIAVAIGNVPFDEAREQARAAVCTICDQV